MPKFNEIGPNEAAKMIIRGALFGAPEEIREKYRKDVDPFTLSDETPPIGSEQVSKINNELLDKFVKELRKIEPITEEQLSKLSEKERINLVREQTGEVIKIANKYINNKEFDYYGQFVKTITGNIASRKVVAYNLAEESKKAEKEIAAGTFGLFDKEERIRMDRERDEFQKQLEEGKGEETGLTGKEEKELEDFFNDGDEDVEEREKHSPRSTTKR